MTQRAVSLPRLSRRPRAINFEWRLILLSGYDVSLYWNWIIRNGTVFLRVLSLYSIKAWCDVSQKASIEIKHIICTNTFRYVIRYNVMAVTASAAALIHIWAKLERIEYFCVVHRCTSFIYSCFSASLVSSDVRWMTLNGSTHFRVRRRPFRCYRPGVSSFIEHWI